jgi:NADH dehydrogenase (ubiquinone) 1 alpha subcomplex subunit 13
MPPSGGYESIRYKRNLPIRGPGGAMVFGAIAVICGYGFYKVGQGNLEKRFVCRPGW